MYTGPSVARVCCDNVLAIKGESNSSALLLEQASRSAPLRSLHQAYLSSLPGSRTWCGQRGVQK